MQFSYRMKSQNGQVTESTLESTSRQSALETLHAQGTVLSIEEVKQKGININIPFLKKGISLQDKILFTKNLAGMLEAGLAISRALAVLEKQTKNTTFKEIIQSLQNEISEGGTLSGAMKKYPKVFSALFVSMVRAGEESGGMVSTLHEIGISLEKSYALNKKIKSAMMYPAVIISAIGIIGILMMIYVVPTLTKTFKDMGGELPSSTKFVIFVSDTMSANPLMVFVVLSVFVVGVIYLLKIKKVKRALEWAVVRLPVVGTIVQESNAARTARTLSSLLSSGVDIMRALEITREVMQNSYYKEVITIAIEHVQKGEPLSGAFKSNIQLYPIMVGEMIEVGEETGKTSAMLQDIAVFYENEVDTKTKDLSAIVEPMLMIFIGAAVGFFAISMLSPMYSLMDNVK
ncbi:MAG: type II secretion system F family protein [Minisyncoccia bacterium]